MNFKSLSLSLLASGLLGITGCQTNNSPEFLDLPNSEYGSDFNIKLVDVTDGFPSVMFGPNVFEPPVTEIEVYKVHNGKTNRVYSGILWSKGLIFDSDFPKPLELVLKSDIFNINGVSGSNLSGFDVSLKSEYTNGLDLLYVIDPRNKIAEPKGDNSMVYRVPKSFIEISRNALQGNLEIILLEREINKKLEELRKKEETKLRTTYL